MELECDVRDDRGVRVIGDVHGAVGDGIDAVCGERDGDERVWDIECGDIYIYDQSRAGDADDQCESVIALVRGRAGAVDGHGDGESDELGMDIELWGHVQSGLGESDDMDAARGLQSDAVSDLGDGDELMWHVDCRHALRDSESEA